MKFCNHSCKHDLEVPKDNKGLFGPLVCRHCGKEFNDANAPEPIFFVPVESIIRKEKKKKPTIFRTVLRLAVG